MAGGIKQIAQNKKAYHNYFISEKFEAGIELFGTEVKSIRQGTVNFKDSFCAVKNGELIVHSLHINPYEKGNIFNRDPVRPRRLLMHKREIRKLEAKAAQDGFTILPVRIYLKDSLVKLEVALAQGKKLFDKRNADAEKHSNRQIERAIKERYR